MVGSDRKGLVVGRLRDGNAVEAFLEGWNTAGFVVGVTIWDKTCDKIYDEVLGSDDGAAVGALWLGWGYCVFVSADEDIWTR